MKTVFIPHEKILSYFGMESVAEGDWLQDYAAEATNQFMQDWSQDTGELEREDIEAAGEAVRDKIWENTGRSTVEHEIDAMARAIDDIPARASRDAVVNAHGVYAGKRWGVEVDVGDGFARLYQEAVEGFGLPVGGERLRKKDIGPGAILTVVKLVPEVYGGVRDFKRQVADAFERFEPETGTHWELRKVADKASGKRKR